MPIGTGLRGVWMALGGKSRSLVICRAYMHALSQRSTICVYNRVSWHMFISLCMNIFSVCRFKSAAERATMTETFTCHVKFLMGINDRPGWSVMTRVSKNPSRVGACYSCHQEGVAVYGGNKPAYPGWQPLCCCHAPPLNADCNTMHVLQCKM